MSCCEYQAAAAEARRRAVVKAAGGQRGGGVGGASLRRADAAQVCSNVGFVAVDGYFECSVATAAKQSVSERW